jgi:PAS domain-containing protein
MASAQRDLDAWATGGSTARMAWEPLADRVVWSPSMFKLYGIAPGRVAFDAFLDGIHPEERPAFERLFGDHLRTLEPFVVQFRVLRPDGRARLVEANGGFRVDERGNLERFELDLSYAD